MFDGREISVRSLISPPGVFRLYVDIAHSSLKTYHHPLLPLLLVILLLLLVAIFASFHFAFRLSVDCTLITWLREVFVIMTFGGSRRACRYLPYVRTPDGVDFSIFQWPWWFVCFLCFWRARLPPPNLNYRYSLHSVGNPSRNSKIITRPRVWIHNCIDSHWRTSRKDGCNVLSYCI